MRKGSTWVSTLPITNSTKKEVRKGMVTDSEQSRKDIEDPVVEEVNKEEK